jgi:hypothetical protein
MVKLPNAVGGAAAASVPFGSTYLVLPFYSIRASLHWQVWAGERRRFGVTPDLFACSYRSE